MFANKSITIALLAGAMAAQASPAYVITKSADLGALSQPYTSSLGQTLTPFAGAFDSSDFFVADYGFSTSFSGAFSSASVTFDLGSALQLSEVSLALLSGSAYAGATPSALTSADLADIARRTLATSTGDATTQTLAVPSLAPGHYVVELRGLVTGSAGGSYGGVINLASASTVSPAPEPRAALLGLLGLGFAGLVGRSRRRLR